MQFNGTVDNFGHRLSVGQPAAYIGDSVGGTLARETPSVGDALQSTRAGRGARRGARQEVDQGRRTESAVLVALIDTTRGLGQEVFWPGQFLDERPPGFCLVTFSGGQAGGSVEYAAALISHGYWAGYGSVWG